MTVVVLSAGNDARGDDALGPLVSARLAALGLPGVRLVDAFQFQVEHALDLEGAALALFIDAHRSQRSPVCLTPLSAAPDCGEGSHALAPAQVLAVAARVGVPGPPAWVMSLRGVGFGLGDGLSPAAKVSLAAGWGLLRALMANPRSDRWHRWAATFGGQ